ncbi:MAG: AbrB/MazE/SpoVT family DNA-binding domain-containing protein [Thaumarchaeota archaeon]|nr:AbrB/MazE/SpoVT family DNA-binding domain-containing protein [Nitrososphaerota archaeon]
MLYLDVDIQMSEVGVSSVSEKGQVTIPKEIRDALQLKAGDKVVFVERDDEIVVHKAKAKRLSEVLEGHKPWKESSLEFQRRARKEWSRRSQLH